ncbi:MAG: YidB family protein [Thiomicrorhabdus sp.]|nr:YidB family protein [Thiomicrorhabdus sp.]
MDMSNLLQLGVSAFMKSNQSGEAGSNLNPEALMGALSNLGGGEGGFDVSSLLGKMQGGDLMGMAQSWLGDGDNQAIDGNQLKNLLGSDKISAFASQLGVSESEAVGGLSDALPQMIDKASSGGSILDSIGGVQGAMGLAGKLFGK